jgi:NADPH-dependent F420 reductase
MDNAKAIESADLVVLCVPFETLRSVTADLIDSYTDQIVVSPVVPMSCSKHFDLMAVPEGCAAVLARDLLPKDVRVVSAFHTIAAHVLADPKKVLHGDVPICGDDKEAKAVVSGLAAQIKDLRPMDAGPLAVSRLAEGLTPMLLNVAKSSKMRNLGIQFIQA